MRPNASLLFVLSMQLYLIRLLHLMKPLNASMFSKNLSNYFRWILSRMTTETNQYRNLKAGWMARHSSSASFQRVSEEAIDWKSSRSESSPRSDSSFSHESDDNKRCKQLTFYMALTFYAYNEPTITLRNGTANGNDSRVTRRKTR